MLETLKKNWSIVVGVLILIALIVALAVVMSMGSGDNVSEGEGSNPFGDVSGERNWAVGSDEVFTNPGEAWVIEQKGEKVPLLRAISKNPVAGATAFSNVESGKVVEHVRYSEYSNGHDYETTLATISDAEKISNETRVRIGEVLWNNSGTAVITRYHDENGLVIRNHLGYFTTNTQGGTTTQNTSLQYEGRSLPGNMVDIAFSPGGTDVFYLLKTPQGVTGYTESVEKGVAKEMWSSGLQSLRVSWDAPNMILVHTNPTPKAEGAVWAVHPTTGKETVLLAGETALSPKLNSVGTKLLYSTQESKNKLFQVNILETATGKGTTLPIVTFVEKCTWGSGDSKYLYCAIPKEEQGGAFLERWYMGVTASEDALWRIDTESGIVKKILDPLEEVEQEFDIIDLQVSPKEEFLLFRARGNGVLWSLTLTPPNTITETTEAE